MDPAILIVDDDKINLKLLRATLGSHGLRTVEAGDGVEALTLLESEQISAVISDAMMPRMDGFTLCAEMRAQRKFDEIPFVLYTSTYTELQDEKLAAELGADRFLRKPARPAEIIATIERLSEQRRVTAKEPPAAPMELGTFQRYSQAVTRKLEERNAELQASEARLRGILDAGPDAVQVFTKDGVTTEVNGAGLELYEVGSLRAMNGRPLHTWAHSEYHTAILRCFRDVWQGKRASVEFQITGDRGAHRWLEMHAAPLLDAQRAVVGVLGLTRDVSARKGLEAQFVQAQKMEVIGQLSGGVTHDFNNLLAVIMGCTEVLLDDLESDSPLREYATTIMHTAERAAALTRQLLLFSRKQTIQRHRINLSDLVAALDPILRRTLGEPVKLVTTPDPDLALVEADSGQIEQVIMNLCINARDAMPDGGTIQIATANVSAVEAGPAPGLLPGEYVRFSVRDSGHGMSAEVVERIFEPFFTTKPAGLGTGLGLATCQKIIQNFGGRIAVQSALGGGTTFNIFLPRAAGSAPAHQRVTQEGPLPRGHESILLVEDEPGLLDLAANILTKQGYRVAKAANGHEAMKIVREHQEQPVDLVLTDMVMPIMGGMALASELREAWPEARILFTSGYSDCDLSAEAEEGTVEYLPKPYTPSLLIRKVREVLNREELGVLV